MNTRQKPPLKKILIIALVIVMGVAVYSYWGLKRDRERQVDEVAEQGKAEELSGSPVKEIPEVQIPEAAQTPIAVDVCQESREKLQGLFAYLDRQDYIADRRLKGGTALHFKGLLIRLLTTPPFVQRETDNLWWVLKNMAHFYHVLGKKDTLLVRDILQKEEGIVESSFALFYQVMVLQDKCKAKGAAIEVPLQKVYPYSVFFLNTLGGTAYLMRRDSRVRTLTRYYAILILDQANQRRLNRLGLDIRPPLDILIGDLKGSANLANSEEYLKTLQAIRAKY